MERLFLFSVIWGFGGALGIEEQVDLSNLLKSLTNGLPDDDSAVSVFDYYVDESGEWDVWQTWYETQFLMFSEQFSLQRQRGGGNCRMF